MMDSLTSINSKHQINNQKQLCTTNKFRSYSLTRKSIKYIVIHGKSTLILSRVDPSL